MPDLKNTLVQDLMIIREALREGRIHPPMARGLANVAFMDHMNSDPYASQNTTKLLDLIFPETKIHGP